jgi:hypothetical protein
VLTKTYPIINSLAEIAQMFAVRTWGHGKKQKWRAAPSTWTRDLRKTRVISRDGGQNSADFWVQVHGVGAAPGGIAPRGRNSNRAACGADGAGGVM